MIRSITLTLCTLISFSFCSAQASNEVSNGRLVLTESANQALRDFDSDFRIFQLSHFDSSISENNPAPFFSKTDLNNDGQDDLNIFGYNIVQKKAIALTLISSGSNYRVYVLHQYTLNKKMFSENPIYITFETVRDFHGENGKVVSLREIEKETYQGVERVNHLAPRRFFYSTRNAVEPFLMSFSD